LGSLLTAVASWLDARAHGGSWSLRIDDLDAPRVAPDAEAAIANTLKAHRLAWDGPIVRQSGHAAHYRAALERLRERCFACRCARRALRGADGYPGTCRNLGLPHQGNAVRIRADSQPIRFDDRVQGRRTDTPVGGDFIVRRRDGLASYPLAVVVDDWIMGITHVVRGADLLDETPRQIYLMACLGIQAPAYAHVPVIVDAAGEKLSKHNRATAIDDQAAGRNLATVLTLLGLPPPQAAPDRMLAWAMRRWRMDRVPRTPAIADFVALT